jgi:hypothetical protein
LGNGHSMRQYSLQPTWTVAVWMHSPLCRCKDLQQRYKILYLCPLWQLLYSMHTCMCCSLYRAFYCEEYSIKLFNFLQHQFQKTLKYKKNSCYFCCILKWICLLILNVSVWAIFPTLLTQFLASVTIGIPWRIQK